MIIYMNKRIFLLCDDKPIKYMKYNIFPNTNKTLIFASNQSVDHYWHLLQMHL